MVNKSALLTPWNLQSKASLRIPARYQSPPSPWDHDLHGADHLLFPVSVPLGFSILAHAYVPLSGTLLKVLGVMSHLILQTVL